MDPLANEKLKSLHSFYAASNSNSMFEDVARGCRSKQGVVVKKTTKTVESGTSKQGVVVKKTTKTVESGDHNNKEHLSENHKDHLNTRRHARRIKRRKALADSSDSEVIIPRFRLRGLRRGPVVSCNSITQFGKLDSKTFESNLENIWSGFSGEKRNLFAYLDSLWFSLYLQNSFKVKVLNWIKRKHIFSKKYVIVPIVMWSHWNLLILCNFGECPQSKSSAPCMLLLDSLQTVNPRRLEPEIRKFVLDIHNVEERPGDKWSIRKIPLLIPKVPQQRNGEECGCYVLYYISLFLENAPENFSISEGYPYFMKENWFTLEGLDNFCKRLELSPACEDCSSSED